MGRQRSRSRKIALGGMFSGLALLFLLAGGFIPIGTFAAPIFAGICLVPIALQLGSKWALLCYAGVSLLALLLVPDQELVLFFIALLGYYPLLRPWLDAHLKNGVVRWAAKLLLFNAAVATVYAVMLFLFASPALLQELEQNALWFWAVLLAMGNVTFVLYDRLLGYVRLLYDKYLRGRLLR